MRIDYFAGVRLDEVFFFHGFRRGGFGWFFTYSCDQGDG